MSSATVAAGSTRPAAAPSSPFPAATAVAGMCEPDDDAERAVMWLKVCDVRSLVSRQQRSIGRVRAKLSSVADRKTPLIAALQSELSSQQAAISALRSELAVQQSSFASDEESAHSVYEAALRAIEANSQLALSAAEGQVNELLQATNQLSSFALVEGALQSKCSQLAGKNGDNESKHRQRMADMRREWEVSRAELQQAANSARHDSERRYKQQVMAAINISYSTISDEIHTMQTNKQAEGRQLAALNKTIQQRRQAIAEERERERTEQSGRADSQQSLFDVRLQLRQVERDILHEQHKLSGHRVREAARRQQLRADRQLRVERLESELRGWQAVHAAYERSVSRVRCVVSKVERARGSNSFQQLVEECIDDISIGATHPPHSQVAVASMSDEERQRMLRLLFARIRQAETECVQRRQQRQWAGDQSTEAGAANTSLGAVVSAASEDAVAEDEVARLEAVAHTGPSFFLTQHQLWPS